MSTTAVPISAPEPNVIVQSDLLGPLTISADQLIEFPAGLFGFPETRSFVLLPAQREGLFWLQSADRSELLFLLADPFLFFDDYAVDLSTADRTELRAEEAGEVGIFTIVTLPPTREEAPMTNLLGPIAINLRARRGKQFAIADSEWGVRCPLDLPRS